ncbi:MAG: hypothetical protein HY525_16770 [Betaproteobacteria bacterium]|nr:hypothetical protein [Betaproteobacteria bacterium]
MAEGIIPIRRVVTGNDAQGRSRVLFDNAAPGVKANPFKKSSGMTDIWQFDTCPVPLSDERDYSNLPFNFEPPATGGRLRIVQSEPKPLNYDPSQDKDFTPEHPPRKTEHGSWDRGRQNYYTTRMHKSETLDYGVVLTGERTLITDAGEHVLKPGDVVVMIGSWHAWADLNYRSQMAFVMMAAKFED